MSGRYILKTHECVKPSTYDAGIGSVWECSCGSQWKLIWSGSYREWESVKVVGNRG